MTEDVNVAERDKLLRELQAMDAVASKLLELDLASRERVLRYVSSYMFSLCIMSDPPVTGRLGSGVPETQDDCCDSTSLPNPAVTPREGDQRKADYGDRPGDVPDKYISDVAERARRGLRLRQLWWTKPNKQFDVGSL